MRAKELVAGLGKLGPTTQAMVAGGYAWAITVAPAAIERGSTLASKVAAAAALVALAAVGFGGRRWGARARVGTLWAFVLACAAAWFTAPGALAPARLDVFRGVTGAVAWALFAFAWAAPSIEPSLRDGDGDDEPLAPRRRLAGREGYVLLGAGLLAASIQAVGWDVAGVERSLLVRFVGLLAGLAVIDASVDVALGPYRRRVRLTAAARFRAARPWLLALGALALVGALLAIRG